MLCLQVSKSGDVEELREAVENLDSEAPDFIGKSASILSLVSELNSTQERTKVRSQSLSCEL